jgi:hypothetical protein
MLGLLHGSWNSSRIGERGKEDFTLANQKQHSGKKKGERETHRAWISQSEGPVCSPSCEKIHAELQI